MRQAVGALAQRSVDGCKFDMALGLDRKIPNRQEALFRVPAMFQEYLGEEVHMNLLCSAQYHLREAEREEVPLLLCKCFQPRQAATSPASPRHATGRLLVLNWPASAPDIKPPQHASLQAGKQGSMRQKEQK